MIWFSALSLGQMLVCFRFYLLIFLCEILITAYTESSVIHTIDSCFPQFIVGVTSNIRCMHFWYVVLSTCDCLLIVLCLIVVMCVSFLHFSLPNDVGCITSTNVGRSHLGPGEWEHKIERQFLVMAVSVHWGKAYRQTCRQTHRHADRQTSRQTGYHTDRQAGFLSMSKTSKFLHVITFSDELRPEFVVRMM